ncbi:MAG: hypothetical protein SGCHY_001171 [Lobulomycetales sp.]
MGLRIGNTKFDNRKTWVIFIVGGLLWFGLILVMGFFNIREGDLKNSKISSGAVKVSKEGVTTPRGFNGIAVFAKISTIDIQRFSYTIQFNQFPRGIYQDTSDPLSRNIPTVPVTINYGSRSVSFLAGREMPPQDVSFTVDSGDFHNFPFDTFEHSFLVTVERGARANNGQINTTVNSVNVTVSLSAGLQGFSFINSVQDSGTENFPAETVIISFTRSFTTRFFSVFVILTMWVLSLLILALAASVYLRDRKVEPPTIAFVTGMLFALPAVRNVQPGVPGIGSTADVMGFFWNMMMVALAACLLLVNYIRKYRSDGHKKGRGSPRCGDEPAIGKSVDESGYAPRDYAGATLVSVAEGGNAELGQRVVRRH